MSLITLKFPCICAADSKQGGRNENQDSYGACDTTLGALVIVCDGMGGGPGGKSASTLAVQAIKYAITETPHEGKTRIEILRYAISYANQILLNKQAEFPELRGMGTTCTILLINDYSAIIAHVGDSRVYRIRNRQKSFRTNDHSKVGEMVRSGLLTEEQARLSAESNIITKVLGRPNLSEPEIEEVGYEKGDRFVLCTDGIWGAMPEPDLIKRCSDKKNIEALVGTITIYVDTLGASLGGQHDNLTLAILEPRIDSKYKEPMNKKAKKIIYVLIAVCVLSFLFNGLLQLRLSRLESAKKAITQLNDSCNSLREKNTLLLDSIQKVQNQAEQSIQDTKAGGNQYAEKLTNKITELSNKVASLEKENDELRKQLKTKPAASNQQQTGTGSGQKSTSAQSPLVVIKSKLNELKNCTGKTDKDCATNVSKKQKEIKDYINNNLKNDKNKNIKEKLQELKDLIGQSRFDQHIDSKAYNGKYQLTGAAKKQIDAIINKIK